MSSSVQHEWEQSSHWIIHGNWYALYITRLACIWMINGKRVGLVVMTSNKIEYSVKDQLNLQGLHNHIARRSIKSIIGLHHSYSYISQFFLLFCRVFMVINDIELPWSQTISSCHGLRWYRLAMDTEDIQIHRWSQAALIIGDIEFPWSLVILSFHCHRWYCVYSSVICSQRSRWYPWEQLGRSLFQKRIQLKK